MKVFESELRGKTVMSNEGGYLGILRNVSANVETGDLVSVHVEPAEEIDARLFPQDGQGRITFPFNSIKAVRDVIVVAVH
ncbi:MAG TPA: PRC-barrel domain-containing protein [Candidatus Thermoplasmatota archaeon]|nr:PRC-barrel domain-containing protein [Candidatus Thermoplasmatota archaeon]